MHTRGSWLVRAAWAALLAALVTPVPCQAATSVIPADDVLVPKSEAIVRDRVVDLVAIQRCDETAIIAHAMGDALGVAHSEVTVTLIQES